MFRFVVLVLALAASAYGASLADRIIAGLPAAEGEYPYTVSLRSYNSHFCGGSIISNRWILTAAHCISGIQPSQITVVAGTNRLDSGGDFYQALRTVINPNWNSLLTRNDIALIEVNREIVFGDKVGPIALPTEDFNKVGYWAELSGWGSVRLIPPVAKNELQYVFLPVIDQDQCLSRSFKTTDANICTSTRTGQGACYGDSGSPLVAEGVQIGLVSWGTLCAFGQPDVHTRVWSFVDWIKETINE
ncbi:chymotrypsin-2-like [Diprion similis]|uniref:chymotrypsin-2-like n=1 Tax=Diprion similis TaxID=362088 RepID=UPI001EF8DBC6|nr:chymotrypsin-2-like [Diprion similis]